MRWMGGRESDQVEDQRGAFPGRGVTIGCGTIIFALVVGWLTGTNPGQVLQLLTGSSPAASTSAPAGSPPGRPPQGSEDPGKKFVSVILADTEDTWKSIFESSGKTYELPRLVLYTGVTDTACGAGSSAQGPFYCPLDRKVYLDLSFFDELARRFGAPGDFARAYVIAHEIGHHVQNLTRHRGQGPQTSAERVGAARANDLSVRLELQADCFAGVWGHHAQQRGLLEPGDVEEGLRAAAADRRRPAAAHGDRTRPAGVVHARDFGAARRVAPARARVG